MAASDPTLNPVLNPPVPRVQPPVPQVQSPGGVPQEDHYVARPSAPQSTSYNPGGHSYDPGINGIAGNTDPNVMAGGYASGGDGGGYATQTKIDPTNDYRSQAITPGADPRLQTTQGQTDQAAQQVSGFSGYTPYQAPTLPGGGGAAYQAPTTNDSYTQQAQGFTGQAANALGTGQIASTNTQPAQSILDRAIGQANQLSTQQGGALNYGADTTALRAALSGQSGNLLNGAPSREDLARKLFALLQEQSNPQFQQDLRGVGQKAAALGRIGAGMTTSDLGDVAQRRDQAFSQAARGLSYDAAGQTVSDRLSALQAATGGFGALAGADQAQADAAFRGSSLGSSNALNSINALRGLSQDQLGLSGVGRSEGLQDRAYGMDRSHSFQGLGDQVFGQGQTLRGENRTDQANAFDRGTRLRNENRTDQANAFDRETAGLSARRGILGDLSGLEQQQFGQGLTGRNELRGERDFQTQAAQQGIDNAARQRLMEEQLQAGAFNRNQQQQFQLFNQGYSGQNGAVDAFGNAAAQNQADSNTAFEGTGNLLEEYMKSKASNPAIAKAPVDPSGQNWAINRPVGGGK